MASEHWFRWHHGTVTDPKWRVIASRCVTNVTVGHVVAVWAAMVENASQASPRGHLSGWDDEDVAVCLGFQIEQVAGIRDAMQGKVLDGDSLTAWEKRQPNREDRSTERTRAWRQRQRQDGDDPKRTVTKSDAEKRTVTLETETETEKKEQKKKIAPKGDLFPGVDPQVVADFTALRKSLRAPITPTAVAGISREAAKAGVALEDALKICCERGWRGFKADWIYGNANGRRGGLHAADDALAVAR